MKKDLTSEMRKIVAKIVACRSLYLLPFFLTNSLSQTTGHQIALSVPPEKLQQLVYR